jgi:hypothetical protein
MWCPNSKIIDTLFYSSNYTNESTLSSISIHGGAELGSRGLLVGAFFASRNNDIPTGPEPGAGTTTGVESVLIQQ